MRTRLCVTCQIRWVAQVSRAGVDGRSELQEFDQESRDLLLWRPHRLGTRSRDQMEDCVEGLRRLPKRTSAPVCRKTKRFAVVINLPSGDEAVGALGAGITTLCGPPIIRADALCLVAVEQGKSSMSVGYQAADRKRSSLPNGPRDPSSKTECLSVYARNWETKVSLEAYMTIKGKKQGDISKDAFEPDGNGQVAKGGSAKRGKNCLHQRHCRSA